jgi:outer membrane protein assembly factor BamB
MDLNSRLGVGATVAAQAATTGHLHKCALQSLSFAVGLMRGRQGTCVVGRSALRMRRAQIHETSEKAVTDGAEASGTASGSLAPSRPPAKRILPANYGSRLYIALSYVVFILVAGLAANALTAGGARAQADWPTFGFDNQRTGFNPEERVLGPQNVRGLHLHWAVDLGGPITAQATALSNVATAAGSRNVIYAATLLGDVYALDAQSSALIWHRKLRSLPTLCSDFAASGYQIGVIGTPTIDRTRNALFVVSGDGKLHSLDIGTGEEQAGWPTDFLASSDSPLFNFVYGSPTLFGSSLYLTTASACDYPPYHGQVVRVNLESRSAAARWFVDDQIFPFGGGIWGPGGVSVEPDGSAVFAATGNTLALFASASARYGEHIVRLSPDLQVQAAAGPVLSGSDTDFGATPLLYQTRGCPPQLAVMNKSGALFTYYRDLIGAGYAQRLQISNIANSAKGDFIGLPAFDPTRNRLYVGNPADSNQGTYLHGLIALDALPNCMLYLAWQQQVGMNATPSQDNPAISPVVANGVVYYAEGAASQVAAFDANSGIMLWSTGVLIKGGIFTSPTVVNGQLFVPAYDHHLYAFGL